MSFVASIVKFFLFKLFMWVPVTFVVGYFILAAVMSWEGGFFAEPQRTILIAGSVILATVALTLAVTLRALRGRKFREKEEEDTPRRKAYYGPRYDEYDDYYDRRDRERDYGRYESYNYRQSQLPSKKYDWDSGKIYQEKDHAAYSNDGDKDSFNGNDGATATLNLGYKNDYSKENAFSRRRSSDLNKAEKPLVYATRKDPDILILEYSDKISYFRKSKHGGEPEFICEELRD